MANKFKSILSDENNHITHGGLRIVGNNESTDQQTAWIRSNGDYIVINPVDGEHLYLNWDTGQSGGSGQVYVVNNVYAQAFYDRGDTNYQLNPAGSSVINTITTGAITANGDIIANTHVYGRSQNNASSKLYRFGGLYLTWDSDSYGTAFEHSLTSSYGGTFTDSITLNSYNHIRFNIDSNNNNGTSYFEVGDGTTGTGNVIFRLSQDGNVNIYGTTTLPEANSQIKIGTFTDGSSNSGIYDDDDILIGDGGSISIFPHRRGDYGLNATTATSTTFRSKLNIWSDNEDHITFGGASTHMVSAWEEWKIWINNDSTNNGTLHLYNKSNKVEFARLSGSGTSWINGTFTGNSDLRAPVFYDSNDTNYYVDPSDQSRMKYLNLGTSPTSGITSGYIAQIRGHMHMTNQNIDYVSQLHFYDGVRFYDDGNDSYLNFKYGDSNNGGIVIRNGGNTIKGYLYADAGAFGLLDKDGHWMLLSDGASYTALRSNNNQELTVYNDRVEIAADLRSPIYYDLNNTSYYIHADNTSVLKTLYVGTTGADQTYNIRLDAADKSSIGFHDSGSTIGAITFSGAEGFRLGAVNGSSNYGPHSVTAMDRFYVSKEVTDTAGQAIKGYRLNKATSSSWAEGGTGAQTGWYGGNFGGSEITTKWVDGPHGERTLVAETSGDTGNDYDGGFVKAINNLDINKAHLSIVYIKRISSEGTGNVYHGTGAGTNQITNLSGTSNTNPYFHYPTLSNFPQDVWCVSIGVIQANNDDNTTAKTGSGDLQGIYRCDTGQKIMNSSNYWKMGSAGSTLNNGIRFFHYYSTNANAKVQFAKPGFYEINGDEPSLAEILTGGNRGLHTNGGDVTANRFYDWANTAYYLDPASTSILNDVEIVQAAFDGYLYHRGDTDTYFGFGGSDQIKFVAGGTERLRVEGDVKVLGTTDFNIQGTSRRLQFTAGTGTVRTTTANDLIFQTNSTTAITIDSNQNTIFSQPVWIQDYIYHHGDSDTFFGFNGADSWKLRVGGGDRLIVSSSTFTSNLTLDMNNNSLSEVGSLTLNNGWSLTQGGSNYAQVNSWIYLQNNTGLYAPGNSAHIYPNTTSDYGAWRMDGARNNWNGITFAHSSVFNTLMSNNTTMGLYNDSDNEWYVEASRNGAVSLYNNGSAKLSTATNGINVTGQVNASSFYDSDDTNYYVNPAGSSRMNQIDISSAGATGLLITHTDIRSAATSTWTGNPGGAGKIQYHSNRWYIVADSSSNRIVQFRRDGTDVSYIDNSGRYIGDGEAPTDFRAPIFYDTGDTNYYTNPAGTSIVKYLGRRAHQEGLMVGGYNNIGASHAKTNPIFTIGSSYLPNETTLGNMYGIGYTRGDMSGMPGTSGWGMYVAADGDARIFLDGQNGGVGTASASWRAPIFYDSDNTGYYANPAGASKMNALKLEPGSGNNVSGDDNVLWIHRENNNDWGIQINADQGTATDYGYEFLGGSSHTYAFSGVAAGTRYFQIGSSFGQHSGSFRAPIFYDSDDTNYYLNPASSSTAFVTKGDWRVPSGIAWSGEYTGGGKIQHHSNHWYIQSPDAGGVIFRNASAANRFIFDHSGGYGSASGSWRAPIFYDSADTTYYLDPAATGDSLRVAGDVVAFYSSDERLKNNIKPIDNALSKVCSLSGNTFEWNEISHKETGKSDIGVVAQEVEEVFPEIVNTRDNGYKAVDYQKLSAVLIEAVKELKEEIDELKKQIK